MSDAAVASAQNLVGLLSVRRVTVEFLGDMAVLGHLFGRCTPDLREITFERSSVFQPLRPSVLESFRNGATEGKRTRLGSIALVRLPKMAAWLADENCPLLLRTPRAHAALPPAHLFYIPRALFHILFGFWNDPITLEDLTQGPAQPRALHRLACLHIGAYVPELPLLADALTALDVLNEIRGITVTATGTQTEDALRAFDRAAAALSALNIVELQVEVPPGRSLQTTMVQVKQWLSMLVERGNLTLTSCSVRKMRGRDT
ncbi:hypothetical protein GGX14DRAFT_601472 [Mycena pura]|uniref:Uncharacterized protein n=1 Tax=Mycena pura TaxID=153505 RepID=A0AAD6Y252_9AGAR|nr:hypothetical protein GGX14DRAFT_601472 [Mycena pura]